MCVARGTSKKMQLPCEILVSEQRRATAGASATSTVSYSDTAQGITMTLVAAGITVPILNVDNNIWFRGQTQV